MKLAFNSTVAIVCRNSLEFSSILTTSDVRSHRSRRKYCDQGSHLDLISATTVVIVTMYRFFPHV